jgi:hypothetical protein
MMFLSSNVFIALGLLVNGIGFPEIDEISHDKPVTRHSVATRGVVAVAAANCQPMAAAQDYLYLTTRRHLVPLLAVGGKNPTAAPKAMAARDAVSEVERAGDADTPGTA